MILRTCKKDFTSAHDPSFQWSDTIGAIVVPQKWDPSPECGNGLHGFLFGEGDRDLADWSDDAQWIVFDGDIIINIDGDKVKTNKATILHIGRGDNAFDRLQDCHAFMRRAGKLGSRAFNKVSVGGYHSTNTGGNYSTNTGDHYSTNTGGNRSTNIGGYGSDNTGGDYSTNTGGNYSTNTGGAGSTNTGGYYSTNTGGDYSTNTGGNYSTFQTGENSCFIGEWFDGKRKRCIVFHSGEDYQSGARYKFENGKIFKLV